MTFVREARHLRLNENLRQKRPVTAFPLQSDVVRPAQPSVKETIRQGCGLSSQFVVMNCLATAVGCLGLLTDSSAVLIAGMVVALLMDPLSCMSLALVDADNSLLLQALFTEVCGAAVVLSLSIIIGSFAKDIPLTHSLLAQTHPTIFALMVALAVGAASAFATLSHKLSPNLVGIAVATVLVSPLAGCGICLAHGELHLSAGAFMVFLTSLVAVQFGSVVVMWLYGLFHVNDDIPIDDSPPARRLATSGVSLGVLTFLAIAVGLNFTRLLAEQRFEAATRLQLDDALVGFPGCYVSDLRFDEEDGGGAVVTAVLQAPVSFSPDRVRYIENQLPMKNGKAPDLHIATVIVKETAKSGYLFRAVTNGIDDSFEARRPRATDAAIRSADR